MYKGPTGTCSPALGTPDLPRRSQGELFPPEIYEQINQTVWADGTPGKVVNIQFIKVNLKDRVWVPWKKQYPLKKEVLEGIQWVLQKFLKLKLTWFCQSPYNTPIFPVKKPHSDEYQFVQDLRAINDIVQDIHPMVPSPYILMIVVPGDGK